MKPFFKIMVFFFPFILHAQTNLALNTITLPPGFHISIYAKVPNARSLTLADNGIVFVGTRRLGNVYAVIPNNDFTQAKQVMTIAKNLWMPNGVAFYKGDLYVAEVNRILRYKDILSDLRNPPIPSLVTAQLPEKTHHGWRYLAIGPDNYLYVSIGAPCNVCLPNDKRFATIMRLKPDGSDFHIFAKGIRNSVGFTWHPDTKKLWFTDNGRDWLGDNKPPDELNYAPKAGLHFGFPYIHGNDIVDPSYKANKNFTYQKPVKALGAHVAALGLKFYTGNQFPEKYHKQLFIAEHGSWNRSQKIGYRISLVTLKNNKALDYKTFASGWLQGQQHWGRPVDLLVMPDDALLVSDDTAGVIYRIYFEKGNIKK